MSGHGRNEDAFNLAEDNIELRAHAQLRRRTVSPNRRRSLPPGTQPPRGNPKASGKYPTDPIRERTRGKTIDETKPTPPPKVVNPPQAPYKKTFIAMLMGSNKEAKKRRSIECSSNGGSPPATPTTPDSPVGRSYSLRSPQTPPPKLLPRQTHPQTPPPLQPKNFRSKSSEGEWCVGAHSYPNHASGNGHKVRSLNHHHHGRPKQHAGQKQSSVQKNIHAFQTMHQHPHFAKNVRLPREGRESNEVQHFDFVEPLNSTYPPTISHALVYTHPNDLTPPQHAIVFNPAYLCPHG